jgi:stage II sporulation protein AA (anti-sigma F factor antagonist)
MTGDGRFPVEAAGGVPVVTVPEELDITNAPHLEPALAEAAGKGHGRFVVDMSRTKFCDCAGLHALLVANKKARDDGGRLALAVGGKAVLRLFEVTGAGSVVPCFTSLEQALAHASADGAGDGHAPDGSVTLGRPGADAR